MESTFEEKLASEVRRYVHLYDPSQRDYKDFLKSNNSWKEIGKTLGKDEAICRAKWKYLRDRFSKAKRKLKWARSEDGGVYGVATVPPRIYTMLSWLDCFIKHRETETKSTIPNEPDDAPPPNNEAPDEKLEAWLTPEKPVSLPETAAHPPPSVAVGGSSCPPTEPPAKPEPGGSQQATTRPLSSLSYMAASIRQGQAARRRAAKRRRRAMGMSGPVRPVAAAAVPRGEEDDNNDMYFFAGTVCRFLRKVPEDRIDDLMLKILHLIREHQE
ncbi:uncharacterized protein LOC130372620 [Gadus chalcogrammus]|uniref:uncharacterized protein LOC130372620 n=1 Tax=Gadus chalcogrammus TaxID=1042646 RepID=UPI0024C4765D|nr:uncharacterized protein LOC130372620 [Gadus chalcogrammus]